MRELGTEQHHVDGRRKREFFCDAANGERVILAAVDQDAACDRIACAGRFVQQL